MGVIDDAASRAPVAPAAPGFSGPVASERFDRLGFDGAPVRLGLMGGTFDPVHLGHLCCAEQVRDACALDAVLFLVAGTPSFKRDLAVTNAAHRLAMCRLAVAENPAFDVSALEAARPGITFTVDTLRQLRAHYPENVELAFIVGADAALALPEWKEADALVDLAEFIVMSRPGSSLAAADADRLAQAGFRIRPVAPAALDISSTEVRRRASCGQSIRYLVPEAVRDYVLEHKLYRKGDS